MKKEIDMENEPMIYGYVCDGTLDENNRGVNVEENIKI